ncbi:hypothetical protein [Rubinisphaera sp. JC750]|nr:hypothetical protein [Rubinisphaera sp. JC750]
MLYRFIIDVPTQGGSTGHRRFPETSSVDPAALPHLAQSQKMA